MVFLNIRKRDATSKQAHFSLWNIHETFGWGGGQRAVGQFHIHTHTCERVSLKTIMKSFGFQGHVLTEFI